MNASQLLQHLTVDRRLREVFEAYVSNKKAAGRDGVVPTDLIPKVRWDAESRVLRRKLRAGSYQFAAYKQVLASKGAGKPPRVLSLPTARDRVALRVLSQVLAAAFPEARTPVPQSLLERVMAGVSSGDFHSFVRLDLKNFYPTISHDTLERAIRRRIRSKAVIALTLAAVRTPTLGRRGTRGIETNAVGIPQGLAISNVLAEISFGPVDERLSRLVDCQYFRYVDDILILCRTDPQEVYSRAVREIKAEGFEAHPLGDSQKSMVGRIDQGIDYLGYVWDGGSWGVRASSMHRVIDSIAREFSSLARLPETERASATRRVVQRVNLTITGCIFERHARGWIHFYSQMTDVSVVRRLDRVVRRLAKRYRVDPHQLRSFERAYWLIRHPDARARMYLPDFDRFTRDEMRALLEVLAPGRNYNSMQSPLLERTFRAEVQRIVSRLERDIGNVS